MKVNAIKTIVIFCVLTVISSCYGQNTIENVKPESNNNESKLSLGKTVKALDDRTMIIFQDNDDNYWFGSNGAIRYDGNTLTQFTTEDGLNNNGIRSIQEDDSGNIYFDTGEGINKFNGKTIEKIPLSSNPNREWKLTDDDLWFEGKWGENGLYRYDGDSLYLLELSDHELENEFNSRYPKASFSPFDVYKIFKDSKGNIWFGTSSFGACRFDGESFSWISEREMTEIDPGPAMGVRSILEDDEGYFWFASNINHKYQIHEDKPSIKKGGFRYQQLEGIETSKFSNLNSSFMSIAQDDNGDIWMQSYREGVWRYNGKNIKHYEIKGGKTDVLLFSIFKDNHGSIWLGTHNAGAYRFNGETFEKFSP
jgi:ligand-binding sensor domain-containing protein